MYKLTGVTKTYPGGREPVTALAGVDLIIEDGAWLAIQGPTGHGKTTLLQMLGALDRPTSGLVELDGQDLARMRDSDITRVRAESIGFVFQTFNLIPTLSAQENVETALVPQHVASAARAEMAALALASVGLADRASHLPSELSGGQQQRVAIARALVKQPAVLLADEPTGNLDEDTRDEIVTLLEEMWVSNELTMILVTHDSSVARRAQRVGVMRDGRIAAVQENPAHRPMTTWTSPTGVASPPGTPWSVVADGAPDQKTAEPDDARVRHGIGDAESALAHAAVHDRDGGGRGGESRGRSAADAGQQHDRGRGDAGDAGGGCGGKDLGPHGDGERAGGGRHRRGPEGPARGGDILTGFQPAADPEC